MKIHSRVVLISEVKVVKADKAAELAVGGRLFLYHSSRPGMYGVAFLNFEAPNRERGAIVQARAGEMKCKGELVNSKRNDDRVPEQLFSAMGRGPGDSLDRL